ncbi:MAG: metallophosphoesterase [Acidobacteria bacterium]|nr:metallophosphoesterase [Acidobacteriota bacterium]
MYAYLAAVIFAAAVLCVAYGYYVEPHRLVITRQDIALPNWPKALDGYKIAAIGDIHAGSNGVDDAKLRRIVEETNALNPDLIVLLGDYISEKNETELKMPISEIADGLVGLKARDGVLAVLGNHDGFSCPSCIKTEFQRVGIKVLDNTVVQISSANGGRFRVLGLPDHMQLTYWKLFSDNAKRALAPTEGQGPVIALQHSPDILEVITGDLLISKDLSLILAAHTHGGQVRFPIIGAPIVSSSYGQKYTRGLIKQNGVQMFVTSGVGESILPFRFGVPPEIALLTLTNGGSSEH